MKKRDLLLEILKKSPEKVFSATELSRLLGVTDRSIRYYVRQINDNIPDLIVTNRAGYQLQQQLSEAASANEESVEGRRFSILRQFLKNENGVNLFDLSEELWISESTVRADMTALQALAQRHELKIEQHNFTYFLVGSREAKRNLMMYLIRRQSVDLAALENEMQKFLGEISLSELIKNCQRIFDNENFKANSYFFENFILHLIIAINSGIEGGTTEFESHSAVMIEEISNWLFTEYKVELSSADKQELALLCDAEHYQHLHGLGDYVTPKIQNALNSALQELSATYLIDFTDEQFLTRLLIHTQNLYDRVKSAKVKRNLSVVDIKVRYPALFDVAVYLSSLLTADLEIEIAEDEIAFLALHIGSFLDEQKEKAQKIRTQLLVPDYLGQKEKVQSALKEKFDEQLYFTEDSPELIISTERNLSDLTANSVKIHKFLTAHDFSQIAKNIERVKQNRYRKFLQEKLPSLIVSDSPLILPDEMTKKEVFEKIGNWFSDHGFTEADYATKLFEREKMASTVFASGVSLPHPLRWESKLTGLLVILPEGRFFWGEETVELLIGISVSPSDRTVFNRIFPRMIEILVDQSHVVYLRKSRDRAEFIHRLTEAMCEEDYYE